jgi:hypothetical protein
MCTGRWSSAIRAHREKLPPHKDVLSRHICRITSQVSAKCIRVAPFHAVQRGRGEKLPRSPAQASGERVPFFVSPPHIKMQGFI